MAKKNYYAVKQGKVPGIYRTWDACKAQVHGYPGAIYKGFERLEEAEAFLGGGKMPEPLLRETKGTYFAAPERRSRLLCPHWRHQKRGDDHAGWNRSGQRAGVRKLECGRRSAGDREKLSGRRHL